MQVICYCPSELKTSKVDKKIFTNPTPSPSSKATLIVLNKKDNARPKLNGRVPKLNNQPKFSFFR